MQLKTDEYSKSMAFEFSFSSRKRLGSYVFKNLGFLDYFGDISKGIWKRKSWEKVLLTSDCMSKFKVILLSYQRKTFGFSLPSTGRSGSCVLKKKLRFCGLFVDISKIIWEPKSRGQVFLHVTVCSNLRILSARQVSLKLQKV